MELDGVLFDFSGTLFRLELGDTALDGLMDDAGAPLELDDQVELMRKLTAPVGISEGLPEELHEAWHRRDLDEQVHRTVYVAALRAAGIERPGMAEQLYERMCSADNWVPYPDVVRALRAVRAAGLPIAVVSNIGWDITPVLAHYGVAELVDEIVMSFREGHVKPDPKLFTIACERLGVEPERALMVGDSEEADGGAAVLGTAVAIVDPLPTSQRPDSLLKALQAHGIG
ncbi:HAD family hydrolase [Kutzneria viridogrisea]|uniref:HAD-superfamily hydrolase n=2 Tax=Kutzneria TaxID=43356 RepID=W5W6I7_9PSEU|nr:HAD-IA family hydrolase [Kutzneria albida]AHH93799.1 HAD-superfamily hydrolase [Kutzneria albida DSM 43870]MBA8931196.1 HAD superfamily hydrolase (TIGR01509 family) [Kutzneria viridogrisea]